MANRTVTLTGTTVGTSIATVDIYHTSVDEANLIASGVTRSEMIAGYSFVDDETHNLYYIVSDSPCSTTTTVSFAVSPSPTPTATSTPTPTLTVTASVTPTVSNTPGTTSSVTPTITPSITVSLTPTNTPSNTTTPGTTVSPTNTVTPTVTPTNTASVTPTVTSSITPTPSITNTPGVSTTPTVTLSPTSSVTPTASLTATVSVTPTVSVTLTSMLTATPRITPTSSITPTASLTPTPSITPSVVVYKYLATLVDCCDSSPLEDIRMLSTQALNGGDTIVLNVGLGNRCYSVDSLVPLDPSEPTDFDVIDYYIGDDCATCNIDYPCPSPTPTPSVTATRTPAATPSNTPTNSPTPTPTPTIPADNWLMSDCDGVTANFVAAGSGTIGLTYDISGSGYVGHKATIIQATSASAVANLLSQTTCVDPTPTQTPTPSITSSITPTPSITPTQTYAFYVMSPCDGVSPNFIARGPIGQSGVYEVSGSGYVGVIATIVGTVSGPSFDATLLSPSSCGPSPTPTRTPTRTPTPSPSYTYYTVLPLRPDCTGTTPGASTVRTTLTLSVGQVVGDGSGCYQVTGTTSGPSYDFTVTITFPDCNACQS